MRNRILHIADLHLGASHDYLGARSADRQAEADSVLTRLVDRALEKKSKIGGVIIAGDLFDHYQPSGILVDSVIRDLERLASAGIEILTVPGNHDEYSYPSCVYRMEASRWPGTIATCPNPELVATWHLHKTDIELYAMAYIAGQSKAPYEQIPLSEATDVCRIGVFHGSLDVDWSDRSVPLTSASLAESGLDYVALGHIHRLSERPVGQNVAAYCGRIEGGGFHDPGGADWLEVEPSVGGCSLHWSDFPSRKIETLTWNLSSVTSLAELEKRLEREAERDDDRVLRIRMTGISGFTLDAPRVAARWAHRFYHLDLVIPADGTALPDLVELCDEPTIRGRFVQIARERMAGMTDPEEKELAAAALRLGLAAFADTARAQKR